MKTEKAIVCLGIVLVLAILTSCAFLCGVENAPAADRKESRFAAMVQSADAGGEETLVSSAVSAAAPFEI